MLEVDHESCAIGSWVKREREVGHGADRRIIRRETEDRNALPADSGVLERLSAQSAD